MGLPISNIAPRHRQMMRLLYLGKSYTDIAKDVGIGLPRVLVICKSELFIRAYKEFEAAMDEGIVDIRSRFEELAPEAIEKVASLMRTSQNEPLQRMCAMDILKCAGHGSTKIEVNDNRTQINLPSGTINVLVQALEESRRPVDAATISSQSQSEPVLASTNK